MFLFPPFSYGSKRIITDSCSLAEPNANQRYQSKGDGVDQGKGMVTQASVLPSGKCCKAAAELAVVGSAVTSGEGSDRRSCSGKIRWLTLPFPQCFSQQLSDFSFHSMRLNYCTEV